MWDLPRSFTFDVAAFRTSYPTFEDPDAYPDAELQGYWCDAETYIANDNYSYLRGRALLKCLTLMTAHLAQLDALIAAGQAPAIMAAATIDKVAVTLKPPETPDQFSWWLNTTPYGAALLALLDVQSAGGFGIGGTPTRAGFRGGGRGGLCW